MAILQSIKRINMKADDTIIPATKHIHVYRTAMGYALAPPSIDAKIPSELTVCWNI